MVVLVERKVGGVSLYAAQYWTTYTPFYCHQSSQICHTFAFVKEKRLPPQEEF
jgi:hypothetical protein